ncbi:MAG: hypothetical protein ACHP9Z_12430 [Streptosporangiales bacterium]
MAGYRTSPEAADFTEVITEFRSRGAMVEALPAADGTWVLLVSWPLRWDAPRFRTPTAGRDALLPPDSRCARRRHVIYHAARPRPGPVLSPVQPQAP